MKQQFGERHNDAIEPPKLYDATCPGLIRWSHVKCLNPEHYEIVLLASWLMQKRLRIGIHESSFQNDLEAAIDTKLFINNNDTDE